MFKLLINQGEEVDLRNAANMPYYDQGDTNGCGTASLAMAMTYLGVTKIQKDIDLAIRRSWKPDMFTAPGDIISYARANGLKAQGYNNGRWQNIVDEIMMGNPCICLIRTNYEYTHSPGQNLHGYHYVVISGYRIDEQYPPPLAVFHDPAAGGQDNMEAKVEDFVSMWGDVAWGFRNYYIVLTSSNGQFATNSDRSLSGAEGVVATVGGVADLFNGIGHFDKISVRSFFRGIGLIIAGLTEIPGGGICALTQLAGRQLNRLVDDLPMVRNLVQPIGDALNTGGAVGGDLVQAFGSVTEDTTRFLGNLLSGDFAGAGKAVVDSVSDTSSGIVKAASDACDGLKDVVKHLFQSLFSDSSPTTGTGGVGPSPTGPTTSQKAT